MAVTVADVARAAGVSTATVSVALNGKPGVSTATRQRVRETAERMGYRASSVGRALRVARTGMVGLYLPHTASSFTYYTEVTRGVAEALHRHDLSLVVLPSAHETGAIDGFPDVDGYLLIEPHRDDRGVATILAQHLPVVSGDAPPPDVGLPWGLVESPNEATTRAVYDRFAERGARRPGLIVMERVSSWSLDLERTYRQWCAERDVTPRIARTNMRHGNPALVASLGTFFRPEGGADAVLTAGDGIAVRIAGILRSLGHTVGTSVLLASGVDSPLMEFHTPRITAVDLRPHHFGVTCADLLTDLIGHPQPAEPVHVLVDAPLIARDSG